MHQQRRVHHHPAFVECLAVVGGASSTGWELDEDATPFVPACDRNTVTPEMLKDFRFKPAIEVAHVQGSYHNRRSSGVADDSMGDIASVGAQAQIEPLSLPTGVRVQEVDTTSAAYNSPVACDPREAAPPTRMFSYLLTSRQGHRSHVTSLIFWDTLTSAEATRFWDTAFEPREGDAKITPLVATQRRTAVLRALRSITIITRQGLLELSRDLLVFLHKSLLAIAAERKAAEKKEGFRTSLSATPKKRKPNATSASLARVRKLLDWVMSSIYLPRVRCDMRIHIGSRCLSFPYHGDSTAQTANFGLACVVESVPLNILLLLMQAVLLENKVVLVCKSRALLGFVAATVLNLIHPMVFPHVAVPVLPLHDKRLRGIVHTPVPYLIGLCRDEQEEEQPMRDLCHCRLADVLKACASTSFIFDLDSLDNSVTAPSTTACVPPFPKAPLQALTTQYKKLVKPYRLYDTTAKWTDYDYPGCAVRVSSGFPTGGPPAAQAKHAELQPCSHQSFPLQELVSCFRTFMATLVDRCASAEPESFYRELAATQMFRCFENRDEVDDPSPALPPRRRRKGSMASCSSVGSTRSSIHSAAQPNGHIKTVVIAAFDNSDPSTDNLLTSGAKSVFGATLTTPPCTDDERTEHTETSSCLSGTRTDPSASDEGDADHDCDEQYQLLPVFPDGTTLGKSVVLHCPKVEPRLRALQCSQDVDECTIIGAVEASWANAVLAVEEAVAERAESRASVGAALHPRRSRLGSLQLGTGGGRGDEGEKKTKKSRFMSVAKAWLGARPQPALPGNAGSTLALPESSTPVSFNSAASSRGSESPARAASPVDSSHGPTVPLYSDDTPVDQRLSAEISFDKLSGAACPRCSALQTFTGSALSIACRCGYTFTPTLSAVVKIVRLSGSIVASHVYTHQLISPEQLLKEIGNLRRNMALGDAQLAIDSPLTFWNLACLLAEQGASLVEALPEVSWATVFPCPVPSPGGEDDGGDDSSAIVIQSID
eukprot:Rhum_TRINITY_DN14594_c26_g1::Rhum_TRINITY_DN14594_c26_g1_i1::g.101572::m.101572